MIFDDDDLREILVALASKPPEPRRTLSRGEQVSRAARLERELRRLLATSPPQLRAAQDLFVVNIEAVALPVEIIELGHALQWPERTAQVVAERLLDALAQKSAWLWSAPWERLALLPLQRLDLATLRALHHFAVEFGLPFEQADPEADVPEFILRLHQALLDAGASCEELDEKRSAMRRFVAAKRDAYRDAQALEHSLARRMSEMEREVQLRVPPVLRELWLSRSSEVAARGIVLGDPLEDCYATLLIGGPAALAAVAPFGRSFLFADPTERLKAAAKHDPADALEDCALALDLGRPLQRDGDVDYPVMLVLDESGLSRFICDVAAASADLLR